MVKQSTKDEPSAVRLDGWVAGADALQREMLAFVATRLEKDSEAIKSAITSDNLGDALTIQQQWVTDTVNDYLVESTKVVSLLAQTTVRPVSTWPEASLVVSVNWKASPTRSVMAGGATITCETGVETTITRAG